VSSVADLRAVLAERWFGRLFATRLVSQTADGIFQASLGSAVFFNPQHTTDAQRAAAGFAVLLLPYSLVGPFAGVFLDRWRRDRVLVLANLVRALVVCGVAGLLLATGPSGLAFFVTALVALSVNRFYLSALGAGLPHVVAPARLVMGNSLSTTAGFAVTILGGGVGLGLRNLVGAGDAANATVAVTAAAGYLLSSALARRFPRGLLGPDRAAVEVPLRAALAAVGRGFTEGAAHVWRRRPAAYALVATCAHRLCYGLISMAALLLYRNYFTDHGFFRAGITGAAQALAFGAAGSVAAAVVTPVATRRMRPQMWVAVLFAVASGAELVLGLPYTEPALLGAAFVLGLTAQGSKICIDTILQQAVDESFRGRVFSFYDTLFNLMFVWAAVVGAVLLPSSGRSYLALGVVSAVYAVTAAWYAAISWRPAQPSPLPPPMMPTLEAQRRSSSTAAS
jgi:hypothetical protein